MKKVLLLVLDGFGIRDEQAGNAIKMANLPNLNNIMSAYPVAELNACGESVGLPEGVNGNCEVAFQTMGAGRKLLQPLEYIDSKIKDKSFFENDTLLSLMDYVNDNDSALHLIGMISSSLSHSSLDHLFAIVALAKIKKVKNVIFHFITDGKEADMYGAKDYINEFMEKISKFEIGCIGTVTGRYYAYDKDNNYDRIKKCYDAITYNTGNTFSDIDRCLDLHRKNDISDEFVNPSIITKNSTIEEGDGVLFFDYTNNDELIDAFVDPEFNMFSTKKYKDIRFASLFSISDKVEAAFTREPIYNTFGEYLNSLDYKQSRIAEAEKYQYVTYYFDGCESLSNDNMYKILVPTQKTIKFDTNPQMGAVEVTRAIMASMDEDIDFILADLANPDCVAHTGNIPATIRALEICDYCIGKILEKAEENFYTVVITSDHGNCETMKLEDKLVCSNTQNKVPFVIVDKDYKIKNNGTLCDIIPTVIDIFEISKPEDMTGESLIIKE